MDIVKWRAVWQWVSALIPSGSDIQRNSYKMLEAPLTLASTFCWPWFDFWAKSLSFLTEAQLHNTHPSHSAFPIKQPAPLHIYRGLPARPGHTASPPRIPNLPATYLRDYCGNGASYSRLETKAKLKQGLSTNTGTTWQGGDPITLITQRSLACCRRHWNKQR